LVQVRDKHGREKKCRVYAIVVGKPDGKKPLGRHGRRWDYGIKINLTEIE